MKKLFSISVAAFLSLFIAQTALAAAVNVDWVQGSENTPPSSMTSELTLPKVDGDIHQTDEFNAVIKTLFGISNDAGNIGIGTVAPKTKLHVAGEVTINSLKGCNNAQTVKTDDNGLLICADDLSGGGGGTDGVVEAAELNGDALELSISNGTTVTVDLTDLVNESVVNVEYKNNKLIFTTKEGSTIEIDITEIFEDNDTYVEDGKKDGNDLILTLSDGTEITLGDVLSGGDTDGFLEKAELDGDMLKLEVNKNGTMNTVEVSLADLVGESIVNVEYNDNTKKLVFTTKEGDTIEIDITKFGGQDTDWVEKNDNVYRETGLVGIGTTPQNAKLTVSEELQKEQPIALLGNGSTAKHWGSVAIGTSAHAGGRHSIAIGSGAKITDKMSSSRSGETLGEASIVIGVGSSANEGYTIVAGHQSQANGERSNAFGYQVKTEGYGSSAIGSLLHAKKDWSNAFGTNVIADAEQSLVIGQAELDKAKLTNTMKHSVLIGAKTGTHEASMHFNGNTGGIALGQDADAGIKQYSLALGQNSKVESEYAVALGAGAKVLGQNSFSAMALGLDAKAEAESATAVGHQATASGARSNAFGYQAHARGQQSIAIGRGSRSEGAFSTGIGLEAVATGSHTMTLGIADPEAGDLVNDTDYSTLIGAKTKTNETTILMDGTTGGIRIDGYVGVMTDPVTTGNKAEFVVGNKSTEGDIIARGYDPELAVDNLGGSQSSKTAGIQFQLVDTKKAWNIALDGNDNNVLKFDDAWQVGDSTQMTLDTNGVLRAKEYGIHGGDKGLTQVVQLTGANGLGCTMTVEGGLITKTNCQ